MGTSTLFKYDAMGRLTKPSLHRVDTQDGVDSWEITSCQYNGRGLTTRMTDALGHVTTYTYDGDENLVSKTDADSYTTEYTYNGLDMVTHINYNGGRQVEYAYNAVGDLVRMEDWTGVNTFEYDGMRRVVRMDYPHGWVEEYEYDSIGQLLRVTDSVLELYCAKARFYDPLEQRFTAIDPILDPSKYDLREYATNPVQLVQYLYVENNPVLFTDLLGLNPTNALLNINWDKVLKASVTADNVRGQEQYISLNSVWKQLQTYYPNAETYSKNGYSVYTVSDGGNYIQFQKRPDKNTIEVSMLKDGKVKTYSLTQKSILNNDFVSKNSLERYFRKVWCEDYYLDNISNAMQKDLIKVINQDIENLKYAEEKEAYRALKNLIRVYSATSGAEVWYNRCKGIGEK